MGAAQAQISQTIFKYLPINLPSLPTGGLAVLGSTFNTMTSELEPQGSLGSV